MLTNRLALLQGAWGTGKTHLLCDLTQQRLNVHRPVVLALAKTFQQPRGITDRLCKDLDLAPTLEESVALLDELGAALDERVLILIDGINEGPRQPWRKALDEIADAVKDRQHVALLVSCRSPFEDVAISSNLRSQQVAVQHTGFDEREFDAQAEFFRYYDVPLPEVPLLNEEFSRPLTLKLICEAFRDLRTKKAKEGFAGIASGQKGMTFVLEAFVKRAGAPVEQEFGLAPKACWFLLKGSNQIADAKDAGFAPHMATTLRDFVSKRAALRIIRRQHPALPRSKQRRLLDALRTNGLIDEDMIWVGRGAGLRQQIVYRLPYQRFSDHLIARHLLDKHLDRSSPNAITKSFGGREPLGRIFRRQRYSDEYARPGWAEALTVEFPEHVKRVVNEEKRELLFFLPRRTSSLARYYGPFLRGLFWRAPQAITKGTSLVVGTLLSSKVEAAWYETVDALIAISIKAVHPYSASRFYNYLARLGMAERDLKWGEYLRNRYQSPSIVRLLRWVDMLDRVKLSADIVPELVVLLSLILTTVARRDRDLVTRALVVIGERYPAALFNHTTKALAFNDPYVGERMLAASYGVAMSKWAHPGQFRATFVRAANRLYEGMFAPGAAYATHHALSRDYATNFIRLVLRLQPGFLSDAQQEHLVPPFAQIPSPFPPAADITDEQCRDGESAIHMDFGNYTMGRLVKGRRNYDDANPDYKGIRRQIEWRIGNLGYRKADFGGIDRMIGSDKYYAEQRGTVGVDRYGKKYSWIAYFEMYGLLEGQRVLEDWRLGERASDADIDPSFPKRPPDWQPPFPAIFAQSNLVGSDWLRNGPTPDFVPLLRVQEINGQPGPWVLLEGFIMRQEPQSDREIFTFLRGLIVRKQDVDEIEKRFMAVEYPGNSQIPDPGEDYYLYAGEAVLLPRHGAELRSPNGRYRRQIREAFDSYEQEDSKDNVPLEADPESLVTESLPSAEASKGGEIFTIRFSFENTPKYRHIPGVKVELPSRSYSWESYHSALNDFSGFKLPAPRLIQELDLRMWDREIDYRDTNGGRATLYRQGGERWNGDQHRLLYIREDLIRKYLAHGRRALVWCNWGERDWINKGEFGSNPQRDEIFQSHSHIHRRFVRYTDIRP